MIIDEIAQHIHNQSIGVLGTSLFKGYLPATPDTCISVLDTGGVEPSRDIPTYRPTFQVFIRAVNYSTGKAKLDAVRAALHQKRNQQLVPSGTFFYYIYALAEGGHLGRDDNGLDLFSINFTAETR